MRRISRPRFFAHLVLLLAFAPFSRFTAADTVTDGTTVIRGSVVRISANGCTMIDGDGKAWSFGAPALKSMKIDLGENGRAAEVTLRDGRPALYTLTSKENDRFVCRDRQGNAVEAPIDGLKDCILYPTASFRKILPIDYVAQKPDFCGEACVEMVTSFLGDRLSQDKANQLAGLTEERGVYSNELERVIRKAGLVTEPQPGSRMRDADDALVDRLRLIRSTAANRPVILGVWADPDHKTNERNWNFDHFVLLVGFDLSKHQVLIHDPARKALREVSFEALARCRQNRSSVAYSITVHVIRNWKTRADKTFRAELLELQKVEVHLRADDGTDLSMKRDHLSEPDQAFLNQLDDGQAAASKN